MARTLICDMSLSSRLQASQQKLPSIRCSSIYRPTFTHGFRCALFDGANGDLNQSIRAALSDNERRAGARLSLLAVNVTLPEGLPARFGSNAVKDVAGYDLKRLFVGSGNAFGMVDEVTLQVRRGRASGR